MRLEPLDRARHEAGLAAAVEDGALWTIPVTRVPRPAELGAFFADADDALAAGRELAFATVEVASASPTDFLNTPGVRAGLAGRL